MITIIETGLKPAKLGHLRLPALAALLLLLAGSLYAQDSFFDEDDLFGSIDAVVETVAEADPAKSVKSLLVSDAVRIGGRLTGKLEASFRYHKPWDEGLDLFNADEYGLAPSLASLLFFDARPTEASRFYGSVKAAWPFSAGQPMPDIEVFELFSDFNYDDSLFFRFGKQTINWGVGYFFSPANIINLEKINVLDPEAQLEGPLALRVHYPVPGTQHNLWAYGVFDSKSMKPEDTAMAAKAEFALASWELGAGAFYKYKDPFTLMATASGSAGKFSLFGEATAQLGTKRVWVTEIATPPPFPDPFEDLITKTIPSDYDHDWFFKASAGFMYRNSDAKINLLGQYLYDGEGYANKDRKARVQEARDIKKNNGPLIENLGLGLEFDLLLKALVANSGQHYAALSFSRRELFLKKLDFSVFAMGNLSDLSAFVRPELSYSFFDGLSASLGAFFALGYDDGEYIILSDGRALGISLAFNIGSGAF
ncbi:hypothetical protein MASR2M29_17070 [Spirochaetota bacterium]